MWGASTDAENSLIASRDYFATTRRPHDSTAIADLLTSRWGNKLESDREDKQQMETTNHYNVSPIRMPLRTVPRPEDSVQMIKCIRDASLRAPVTATTISHKLLDRKCTSDIQPSYLSDYELRSERKRFPTEEPVQVPGMTLELSPTNVARSSPKRNPRVPNGRRFCISSSASPLYNTTRYSDPPRVGEMPEIWNFRPCAAATRGFVKSNLPTLVGVRGLGDLSTNSNIALPLPQQTGQGHPTARLHPTYLNQQQTQCLDRERVGNLLSTLRSKAHRPALRFLESGQGTAAEIERERMLQVRQQRQKERMAFVDKRLFSPVKSQAKHLVR